ncbi:MAG: dihydrofolate reductase family protein [Acidimicrobiales bacterium]
MSKVCVRSFSVSLDGFGAGPRQDESNPIGVGGSALHRWIFATKTGRSMVGQSGGAEGVDDAFFKANLEGEGATIMGRNMFGPIRGPWTDGDWQGWWGEDPPFHQPVFVLTHYERRDLILNDTTFHFVTDGIDVALALAFDAAKGGDVGVAGGVSTIRQILDARLIDELVIAVVPIHLGSGERLFETVGEWPPGYECLAVSEGEGATHYELVRVGDAA